MQYICTACESVTAKPKTGSRGNILIALILLCCYIIPGVIYLLWDHGTKYRACPKCGARELLDTSTPRGQRLLQQARS
jgi:DNA-directed RNA polymerase subunit RPC12/RpoP